jgi:hypothetical protein
MSLKELIDLDAQTITITHGKFKEMDAAYILQETKAAQALEKVAIAEQALHETSARYAEKETELNKALAEQGALVLRLQEELKNIPPVASVDLAGVYDGIQCMAWVLQSGGGQSASDLFRDEHQESTWIRAFSQYGLHGGYRQL